jgi:hypothetical protein
MTMRPSVVVLLEVAPAVDVDDLARDELAGREMSGCPRDLLGLFVLRERHDVGSVVRSRLRSPLME